MPEWNGRCRFIWWASDWSGAISALAVVLQRTVVVLSVSLPLAVNFAFAPGTCVYWLLV